MTIHSRSDVAAVTISPEHGGCGDLHSRPVRNGAPVKLWSLDCEACEEVLRKDSHPHWSPTISGIPETPDEKEYREDQEVKGQRDQHNQTADALAKLATLGDLPAAIAKLAEMFNGGDSRKSLVCPTCSTSNSSDARFCGECGLSLALKPIKTLNEPEPPAIVSPPQANLHIPGLEDLTEDQLRALAKERGLNPHHRAGRASLTKLLEGGA